MAGALAGLRVLDWSDATGRLAGKLLAEAGADVLRLRREAPGRPLAGPAGARGGILDWWFDAGVRRLELDLAHAADRAAFAALAARADLLIETAPPGHLHALGVDYEALSKNNPRLVHVSLTPFGRGGPRAAWQSSDLVAGALGGPVSVTGTPEQPLNTFGRQWFNVGGFYAAICGLAAVHQAQATGRGQHVDLSLHQSVISCTEQVLMYWFFKERFGPIAPRQGSLHWTGIYHIECLANGVEAQPAGNRDAYELLEPDDVYLCADARWVAVTVRSDVEWLRFCDAIGDRALAADERLRTAAGRRAHAHHIDRRLSAWAAGQSASDAEASLQQHGIPAGVVQDARDLAENDPQLRAREWLAQVQHTQFGTQEIDRFPATFSAAELAPYRAAPGLGEHIFEVYAELLGMPVEDIATAVGDGLFV